MALRRPRPRCESWREHPNERCPENKKQKPPKLAHDVMSDKHACSVCGKPIKQRLVNQKKRPPKLCYGHWLIAKGLAQRKRE